MRPLRYLVHARDGGKATVEVTARTLQARFLLRPDSHVNSIIHGVLARGKERFRVEIHGHVALSNHIHLLLSVQSVKQLSRFMQYVMSNIARKVGRYVGWRGRFWDRRYRSIEVSPDEESLVARLDYILQHGTKESLVSCPTQWPGAHCAWHFAQNQWSVRGHWDNLTKAFRMRHVGKKPKTRDIRTDETFELDPLPCWAHWERRKIRAWVLERLETIREMYADQTFLGVEKIRRQNIADSPDEPKSTPATDVHSKDPQARRDMREAYREFVRSFYAAAGRLERLLELGIAPYYFPTGCHPPRPGCVPETA